MVKSTSTKKKTRKLEKNFDSIVVFALGDTFGRFIVRHKKFLAVVVAIFLVCFTAWAVAYRSSAHQVTFTVNTKPPRIYNSTAYPNLIYTNRGVFQNTDSILFFKFRSSDVYNQIEEKKTYTCTVAGWRFGFLSWYRNIIDCNGFVYY